MVLTLVIMAASGQAGLFEDLQQDYIDNVYDLPAPSGMQSDKAWSPSQEYVSEHCRRDYNPKFVFGWLDIVGFDRSVKIDDKFYLNESAATAAIIQYETYACVLGHRLAQKGWVRKLETYQQGDQFVAKLTATAILYSIDQSGYVSYDNETRIFYDYEPLPLQFTQDQNFSINETHYINRISNKTIIQINGSNLLKYTITAGNSSITRRLKIGHVEYTNKGVPYMNLTRFETWNTTGGGTSHQENDIILSGVNISYSLNASTPYYSYFPGLIKNTTTHEIKDIVISFTFLLLFIFGIMFGGIYFIGRILW